MPVTPLPQAVRLHHRFAASHHFKGPHDGYGKDFKLLSSTAERNKKRRMPYTHDWYAFGAEMMAQPMKRARTMRDIVDELPPLAPDPAAPAPAPPAARDVAAVPSASGPSSRLPRAMRPTGWRAASEWRLRARSVACSPPPPTTGSSLPRPHLA